MWRWQVYILFAIGIRYIAIWRNLNRRMYRGWLWFLYRYWGWNFAFVVI